MSSDYWKGVLTTARKRLVDLRARRDELDAEREEVNLEIVQVEQVVANLTPLVSDVCLERLPTYRLPNEIKLADACREILQKNDRHMTPIEIRSALEAGGYDLTQHTNALASIHGVLKRLAESGEAEQLTHDIRGTMYRWKVGTVRLPGGTSGKASQYQSINGGAKGDPAVPLPSRPRPGHRADPPPSEGPGSRVPALTRPSRPNRGPGNRDVSFVDQSDKGKE